MEMKGTRLLLGIAVVALCAVVAGYAGAAGDKDGGVTTNRSTVPGGFNGNLDYTGGPNVCGECHEQAFNDWLAHGHSRKLGLAFELGEGAPVVSVDVGDRGATTHARSQGIPLPTHDPEVYNWDNVLMVVGTSKHWKSRFVGLDGYFLTLNGLNQYNWENGEWVDYNADVVMKPFDCGTCHTTGYQLEGTYFNDELGIPGIVGDFSHINITCEACHGPGAAHAAAPSEDNIIVDDSAAACGTCHTRGSDNEVVLASGGFIRHHEQYPEMLAGAHRIFDFAFEGCASCHQPHIGRYEGTTEIEGEEFPRTCETCHPNQEAEFAGSSMQVEGVECIDCHMGFATRSARSRGPYEGDVWTHLFRINSEADYDMFERDEAGNTVAVFRDEDDEGALSLEFACFRCHADADKAAYAAIGDEGPDYHMIGK